MQFLLNNDSTDTACIIHIFGHRILTGEQLETPFFSSRMQVAAIKAANWFVISLNWISFKCIRVVIAFYQIIWTYLKQLPFQLSMFLYTFFIFPLVKWQTACLIRYFWIRYLQFWRHLNQFYLLHTEANFLQILNLVSIQQFYYFNKSFRFEISMFRFRCFNWFECLF